MSPTHDESGDDTTSSLGDSSYDFIDDRSNATSDDEDQDAMTQSTNSSDAHAFEQVHAPLQGTEQSPHSYQHSPEQGSAGPSSQEDSLRSHNIPPSQSLGQPVVNLDSQHEQEPIEFDEPSITNLNSGRFTEVSHTLKIIERQSGLDRYYHNLLDRLQGHLAISVRQTMTSHSITPKDGQYKILYVGDTEARESIIQKIGSALAASLKGSALNPETPRSSRFNIVPISAFGEESSPEVVLIDSSGLELVVEDCRNASFARNEGSDDSLRLELSNGTVVHSSWNGSKFTVSDNWRLPDLAVFCLPEDDNLSLNTTRQCAKSFMSRHKVFSVVISQRPTWDKPPMESIALDYLTPHVCLESRKSSLVHAQIIRRYPIDLVTFLNIDAGQMNRNIACIATASGPAKSQRDHRESIENMKSLPNRTPLTIREIAKSIFADVQKEGLRGLHRYEYIAGLALLLMSLLSMLVLGRGLSELSGASRASSSRVFPTQISASSASSGTISSTTSLIVPLSLATTLTPIPSSPLPTSAHMSTAKSLSKNTDLASFLLDAYTLAPNKSEKFQVHVLGDYHIVLRPPHWFSKMKKSPKLLFTILRGGSELEHHVTTLFDGVHALQLPREDAHGMVTVKIRTESRPIINEDFEVDFGSSWLKVAGWKKATRILTESLRGELNTFQTGLSAVYDHTKTGLSTFVQQQTKKVAAQKSADKAVLKSHLKAATKTKELVVAQTKDLQRIISTRFHTTRTAASDQILRRAEKLTKDLTLYAFNKTTAVTHQAQLLRQIATGVDLEALVGGTGKLRQKQLRETQKRVLKAWWNLTGAPKQEMTKARVKNCSRMRN